MSTDRQNQLDHKHIAPQVPGHDGPRELISEDSLEQSERKYQRLVEGISGDYVIYTHDPEGEVTYVSPSVEHVLGFSPAVLVGLNWRDLIGEHFMGRQDADRVREEVDAGKTYYRFTVEMSHADGSTRLVEIQQRPLFDSAGTYISMEGIAKDITESTRDAEEIGRLKRDLEKRVAQRTTELRHANEMLRESESRYRTVVECQTEFIVRWLPEGIYTFINQAYCRYFNRTSEELVGSSFFSTIYEEDRELLDKHIASLTRDTPIGSIEHRVYRPDGSIGWTQWTNRVFVDDEGQPVEYQSAGRDITELKHSADKLREKEMHLVRVSRLATMGELVTGIAHEIHQPLHAAKTFAEAARRNLEAGLPHGITTAIDCTNEISQAITRTAKIIRHLREFTKSRPIQLERLDLNCVVQEAAEIVSFEKRKARVKTRFELSSEVAPVQGDRVLLEQACINLLMNAFDSMGDLDAADRVLIIRTKLDNNLVILSFQDAGCGIQEQTKNQIFDPFYTTKDQGLGMGLSICQTIAEAHSGEVCARPNDGQGTTFVLSLPRYNDLSGRHSS